MRWDILQNCGSLRDVSVFLPSWNICASSGESKKEKKDQKVRTFKSLPREKGALLTQASEQTLQAFLPSGLAHLKKKKGGLSLQESQIKNKKQETKENYQHQREAGCNKCSVRQCQTSLRVSPWSINHCVLTLSTLSIFHLKNKPRRGEVLLLAAQVGLHTSPSN